MCGIVKLYSVRGRKLNSHTYCTIILGVAIYPREGTKAPEWCGILRRTLHCNLPPQGNENKFSKRSCASRSNYNLSSRGDENHSKVGSMYGLLGLQLIPVRGRKLVVRNIIIGNMRIAIYPRKGTETAGTRPNNKSHDQIAIYPRKGTETLRYFLTSTESRHCNLSPQGDKKAPLPLAFASSGGALLFLIFYFTGWALRLPESSL